MEKLISPRFEKGGAPVFQSKQSDHVFLGDFSKRIHLSLLPGTSPDAESNRKQHTYIHK